MNFKRYHESRNLFDKNTTPVTMYYQTTREVITQTAGVVSVIMPVSSNTTYTFNNPSGNRNRICETETVPEVNDTVINYIASDGDVSITLTTSNNTHYILWWVGYQQEYSNIADALSVNLGSTPQPYEPYDSEVWHDIPYYQHKTATDTLTLPATLYPNDTSITVGIKGQSSQSSTPTPQNPVDVLGCGERTANIIDIEKSESGGISDTGELINNNPNTWRSTVYYDIDTGLDYTASKAAQTIRINYYDASKNHISREGVTNTAYKQLDIPSNARYFKWTLYSNNGIPDIQTARSIKPMVNIGSSPLPYEPYGYKIPILSAGQTNNIYLGEGETERKIKKYEFTGRENIENSSESSTESGTYAYVYRYSELNITDILNYNTHMKLIPYPVFISSHFKLKTDGRELWQNIKNGEMGANSVSGGNNIFLILATTHTTSANFKAYLAQQYANGTPVTIYYILATPTTATVNEPLMKIDTYADSLTTSIPVTAGENTLDVQTTVAPSEVTATFEGWHAVSAAHERENGQWD
jgi:hypothetical protein